MITQQTVFSQDNMLTKQKKAQIIRTFGSFVAGVVLTVAGVSVYALSTPDAPVEQAQLATPTAQPTRAAAPTTAPLPTVAALSTTINTAASRSDFGPLSQQIITTQQQMQADMIACTTHVERETAVLQQMKNQREAYNDQIERINDEANDIDWQASDAQARSRALQDRRQGIRDRQNQIMKAMNDRQRELSKYKSACNNRMYGYVRKKDTAETRMNRNYHQMMNIYVR